jgi:hypothetical protein
MSLPLIAFIIGMTFFFGQAMVNQQHVKVADRYVAWREAVTGKDQSGVDLNPLFFQRRAGNISIQTGVWPDPDPTVQKMADTVDKLVRTSQQQLLPQFVQTQIVAQGRLAKVAADFPTDVGLWNRLGLTGAITSYCAREGGSWSRGQLSYGDVIGTVYLGSLESGLQNLLNNPDNSLAQGLIKVIFGLYQSDW